MKSSALLSAVSLLASQAAAAPTWPSSIDELEEIMFQLGGFGARNFARNIVPCSKEATEPGRKNSAEWLRTAFHDMSTADIYAGTGGLDASLQFELDDGENTGPGHNTTIMTYSPFVSARSSLSDLIAMGVYASVRTCGGPVIPLRGGRKDATAAGAKGVPQPQDDLSSMVYDFYRMGFTQAEMIEMTACGHTIGGVHSEEFPDIVPAGKFTNGNAPLDSSQSTFDNKIVTEYLAGTSQDPLLVGPSVKIGKNSDFKVFNADRNVTMKTMQSSQNFTSICTSILQRMIEVVPKGVTLTSPITAYMVKPVKNQLTLTDGGKQLKFTGYIRVKTNDLPAANIKSVTLTYKTRDGSKTANIATTSEDEGHGFDDTFAWFSFSAAISASTGISSYTIKITQTNGSSKTYDNNAKGYPIQDAVLLQGPQSCVSSGAYTLTAAVRNDRVSQGAKAVLTYKAMQSGSPAPGLKTTTITMAKGKCVGEYTWFTAKSKIGAFVSEATVDIVNGDATDSFKRFSKIGTKCLTFSSPAACSG